MSAVRPAGRYRARRRALALATALALTTVACDDGDPDASATTATTPGTTAASSGSTADDGQSIELRDETGPHVDDPDRSMAMTVDAVEIRGDDVLVRVRVTNSDDDYLDMGVQGTFYGPLLVMHDDLGNRYDSYAVEPAGIPGRRVGDLSFRLAGPLDPGSTSFTLELATQRGPLTSPDAALPTDDGIHWRVDASEGGSSPEFAAAPRLPDLVHFWLETDPLPVDG